jgi:hypothetical protein
VPLFSLANQQMGVDTTITKSNKGIWTVNYEINQQVKRLAFVRNPDKSRIERWHPVSAEFEIYYENNKEYIAKKNRSTFEKVTFTLTPTYKHLSKDYAPFSPFSDGGMLFHSGRLFTCIDSCENETNRWKFTINIPKDEHVIINGKLLKSTAHWFDSDAGTNVYVGKQKPIEGDAFIAIIDIGLPHKMQASLSADIPKMMAYFEKKLGKLPTTTKPMLLASYAMVKGHSSQGGTLPNQIFMHWNKDNLNASVQNEKFLNDTLWFFGHEAGHLFQRAKISLLADNPNQSWIHEGHADMLAAEVLQTLYPQSRNFVSDKIERMKNSCAKGLKEFALVDAAKIGQFGYYYTCGMVIYQAIEKIFMKQNTAEHSAYAIWNNFRLAVENGQELGQNTFLYTVDKMTKHKTSDKIIKFISTKHETPEKVIANLTIF